MHLGGYKKRNIFLEMSFRKSDDKKARWDKIISMGSELWNGILSMEDNCNISGDNWR